ncbi:UNVERIFIED_CONTAM: hypothetical protein Sradi_7295700 [Sesamum radiatum]|uniref:Uncharacterized protein n=1 Tax=Sesamum radiatum TaxID=300843 RepID=A0AAW2IH87_SESRA
MNVALMLKQVWRIIQEEPTSIWVAWVRRYRLRNQTLWTVNTVSASWCWRKLVKASLLLKEGLVYRVGDGLKFRLWTDLWHPRGPLIKQFPRGPTITGLPVDSWLVTVIHQGQWCWPSASDFDIQSIMADLPAIYPLQPDQVLWKTGVVFDFDGLTGAGTLNILGGSTLARKASTKCSFSRYACFYNIYNIWRERNSRIFQQSSVSAEVVAARAVEEVRLRIISANLKTSLQSNVCLGFGISRGPNGLFVMG